jgi:hypothetical protein
MITFLKQALSTLLLVASAYCIAEVLLEILNDMV